MSKCKHPKSKLNESFGYIPSADCYAYEIKCKCGFSVKGFSHDYVKKELEMVKCLIKKGYSVTKDCPK